MAVASRKNEAGKSPRAGRLESFMPTTSSAPSNCNHQALGASRDQRHRQAPFQKPLSFNQQPSANMSFRAIDDEERQPLIRGPGSYAATADGGGGENFDHHDQFCNLVGVRPLNHPHEEPHRAHPQSLYVRAVARRQGQSCTYMFTATLVNTLLLSQVVLGAALTGLGASDSSRVLITIFGALNTVIAGVVAFLKSRGQPMRARIAGLRKAGGAPSAPAPAINTVVAPPDFAAGAAPPLAPAADPDASPASKAPERSKAKSDTNSDKDADGLKRADTAPAAAPAPEEAESAAQAKPSEDAPAADAAAATPAAETPKAAADDKPVDKDKATADAAAPPRPAPVQALPSHVSQDPDESPASAASFPKRESSTKTLVDTK
ncbi:hypothetical protein LLEC1_05340 [Akanthomyces lecanii]|uniref:SMODS and SLOG-associating 2TM effector domain-containing protein n=1 Tax=Cordyceps confragosa TaxID=2714763 RepID=A0A179ICC6_CORDF|nr:hypothetical protein LLEC1_05340 [Akanthomyces lecanii]